MISIKTYEDTYEDQIPQFIIGIQRGEFNVPVTLADQPDLAIIPDFYQKTGGNFWIAINAADEVVGTIGLIDIGEKAGTIRKMFVHKDYRGKELGIAQFLFEVLLAYSIFCGMTALYLGTIARLTAAIRFYERNGFTPIDKADLPSSFPLMAVDTHFFQLKIKP